MAIINETTSSKLQSSFIRLDAEFFKPVFVAAAARLNRVTGAFSLGSQCERLTQGSNPKFSLSGIPCVNGKNVYWGTMVAGEPNYVARSEFDRLSGFCLRRNDLVITLKHATKVGRVWVVEENTERIFSRNVGLIRLKQNAAIRPSLLLLYLWTDVGQLLLDRAATGGTTGQITLPMSELRQIPIPPFSDQDQSCVDELFNSSRTAAKQSEDLYTSAQQRLDSELRLGDLNIQRRIGFAAQASELELARRIDAQHYQPHFVSLLKHLESFPAAKMRNIKKLNRRGVQPIYVSGGHIPVVNSQHLGPRQITYDALESTSKSLFAAAPFAHILRDDLLIYTTGAYIGRTNVYLSNEPALASNHVNILRLQPGIDAAYMALVMQSLVGQFQTQKHARGSAQAELYPSDIDKFVVPLLPFETQKAIGDLFRESLRRQLESKRMLEEAKARVEQLIEEAVKP